MRVSDVMARPVKTVAPGEPAERAWTLMRQRGVHHLVVIEDHKILGVVSDADLGGTRGAALRKDRNVEELMSRHVVTAAPDLSLRRVANLMRGRSIGCLPVVDGDELVGIVTFSDLLELLGRGALRPVEDSTRWTMKDRGPRRRTSDTTRATAARHPT